MRVDFAALARRAGKGRRSTRSPAEPSISEAAAGLDGFDLFAEKDIAKAISDYYSANPQFIWVTGQTTSTPGAEQAIRLLGSADSYGLSPADYAVTVPSAAGDGGDAGRPHDRAGALRDDAVGARAALRAATPRAAASIPTASPAITISRPSRSTLAAC